MYLKKIKHCHRDHLYQSLVGLLLIAVSASNIACKQSLQGGTLSQSFSGISSVFVLSPNAADIVFNTSSACISYDIYQFNSSSSEKKASVTNSPYRISGLTADRTYIYGVACTQEDGKTSGLSKTISFTTFKNFNGAVTSTIDPTSIQPVVVLNWSFTESAGVLFKVYSKQSTIPGDLSTWALNNGTNQPSEAPICEVFSNQVRIGPGTSCNPSSIVSGQIYNFKIVANYADQTFSTDVMGVGTSILIPSTFTPPSDCVLTSTGLGPNINQSYLFLKCGNNLGNNGCASPGVLTARAYQAVNNSRVAISESVNIAAETILRVEPQVQSTQGNDREVIGLELEYKCTAGATVQTAVIRYDGIGSNPERPSIKYASNVIKSSALAASSAPANFGGNAMTIADFNCDGKPDLAVGMPDASHTDAPYYSQYPFTGQVKVFYDYQVTSNDVQFLSFRDLPANAKMGKSISSGNINRDVAVTNQTSYSCDDLIIGAPGISSAYIFYGNPQRFQAPHDSGNLMVNVPTCTGSITSKNCPPVRLTPQDQTYLKSHGAAYGRAKNLTYPFGTTVAYVRDFNADGYGDVVVSTPSEPWEGTPSTANPVQLDNLVSQNKPIPEILNVGAIYAFFGGEDGLQHINVGSSLYGADAATTFPLVATPYVKAFPPIPMAGMFFGLSITGGGDVDGQLPVPINIDPTNPDHVILANGDDFIVSAPGFSYDSANLTKIKVGGSNTSWSISTDNVDPMVRTAPSLENANTLAATVTAPLNGAWEPNMALWAPGSSVPTPKNTALKKSKGIAFLYKGRAALKPYQVKLDTGSSLRPVNFIDAFDNFDDYFSLLNSFAKSYKNGSNHIFLSSTLDWALAPVSSFYNCGTRNVSPTRISSSGLFLHHSCLSGRNNFAVLFPTLNNSDNEVTNFGSNLGILGSKEQNSVAQYLTGTMPTFYKLNSDLTDNGTMSSMTPNSQLASNSGLHDRVSGVPLWEVASSGLNYSAGVSNCNSSATCILAASSSASYLVRSPIQEVYFDASKNPTSLTSNEIKASTTWFSGQGGTTSTNTTKFANFTSDMNRDGLADIVITSSSNLFTYFGNYAGDFSYSISSAGADYNFLTSTVGSCTVDRSAGLPNLSTVPVPFKTYKTTHNSLALPGAAAKSFTIVAEYPLNPNHNAGDKKTLRYLGDNTTYTTGNNNNIHLNYPSGTIDRSSVSAAIAACRPQKMSLSEEPASLTLGDLNNDGISDLVLGYPNYNSKQGRAVATYSNSNPIPNQNPTMGLMGNAVTLTDGSTSLSQSGTKIQASSWRFIDESISRDVLSGAPGQPVNNKPAMGMIHRYGAYNSAPFSQTRLSNYTELKSSPYSLGLEKSKIIGSLKGNGYSDIFVPLKQTDAAGNYFYHGILYFGSIAGPITTDLCLQKITLIKKIDGSSISSSDCEAMTDPVNALLDGQAITLPQLIEKKTAFSANWALSVYPAGDVNGDGKDDLVTFDDNGVFLIFGSTYGAVSGEPVYDLSPGRLPQKVTTLNVNAGENTVIEKVNMESGWNLVANKRPAPITHGDFNGDGYEDLAFTLSGIKHPKPQGTWSCSNAYFNSLKDKRYCDDGGAGPGTQFQYATSSGIVIIYGGIHGYQIDPSASYTFDSSTCDSWYQNCTGFGSGIASTYGSLKATANGWEFERSTARQACDENGVCSKFSLILNPSFNTQIDDGFMLINQSFASSLAAADANGDSVDDLIAGSMMFSHTGVEDTSINNVTIYGPSSLEYTALARDNARKGSAFLFYGAKNFGVVAPIAKHYFGDAGLGFLENSGGVNLKNIVYRLYPHFTDGATTNRPVLDGNPFNSTNRGFGQSITSSDFNGDGNEDIAISSFNGHAYIYYGKICSVDNGMLGGTTTALSDNMYPNPNQSIKVQASDNLSKCRRFDLSNTSSLLAASGGSYIPFANDDNTKGNYPEIITIPSVNSTQGIGNTLISLRKKGPTMLGDSNGDIGSTRYGDLLIAGRNHTDPNVQTTQKTGLGYLLFGSQNGIFFTASMSPTYNPSIVKNIEVVGGTPTAFYYLTPKIMRPYPMDGTVTQFFNDPSTAGDLNGDGKMDLLMPTIDVKQTADPSVNALSAGGFSLFY